MIETACRIFPVPGAVLRAMIRCGFESGTTRPLESHSVGGPIFSVGRDRQQVPAWQDLIAARLAATPPSQCSRGLNVYRAARPRAGLRFCWLRQHKKANSVSRKRAKKSIVVLCAFASWRESAFLTTGTSRRRNCRTGMHSRSLPGRRAARVLGRRRPTPAPAATTGAGGNSSAARRPRETRTGDE